MKVVTFGKLKGGVGATSLAVNFACELARSGSKVLFMDLDHQLNATGFFNAFNPANNVKKIFLGENLDEIEEVYENLWVISGSLSLDEMEVLLSTHDNKILILDRWFFENKETLEAFDYIIIDTRPEFSTVVKNAIYVSNVVVCPLIPSEFSDMAQENIEVRFEEFRKSFWDYRNNQSHVRAKMVYVGNMLGQDKESKQFLSEKVETVANFPKRVVFNRSLTEHTPFCEMSQNNRLRKENEGLFELIEEEFEKLKNVIDSEVE